MKVSEEIETLYDIVIGLLKADPKYRDSDKTLSARIWAMQIGGVEGARQMSAYTFFCLYCKDGTQIYSQESIGRARRKAQEEHPELRGANYKDKQEHQTEVKATIKDIEDKEDDIKSPKLFP